MYQNNYIFPFDLVDNKTNKLQAEARPVSPTLENTGPLSKYLIQNRGLSFIKNDNS